LRLLVKPFWLWISDDDTLVMSIPPPCGWSCFRKLMSSCRSVNPCRVPVPASNLVLSALKRFAFGRLLLVLYSKFESHSAYVIAVRPNDSLRKKIFVFVANDNFSHVRWYASLNLSVSVFILAYSSIKCCVARREQCLTDTM